MIAIGTDPGFVNHEIPPIDPDINPARTGLHPRNTEIDPGHR
jgi:hypothetical protein